MALRFESGSLISQCLDSITGKNGIRSIGKSITSGDKISSKLVYSNVSFADLFILWIKPCISLICESNEMFSSSDRLGLIFYQSSDLQYEMDFLNTFIAFVKGYPPYRNSVWPLLDEEKIISSIDSSLPNISNHMRLRIIVICLLCGLYPHEIFSEGSTWFSIFASETYKNQMWEINGGEELYLSTTRGNPTELFPKSLYNNKDKACNISICFKNTHYTLTIPPYGILRAIFYDSKCSILACVKGNISFNDRVSQNALVQLPSFKGLRLYLCSYKYPNLESPLFDGFFVDASVDGMGAAKVIQGNGVYDCATGTLIMQERIPIRIYGAGKYWAQQFKDGSLITNMKKDGKIVHHASAIIEDSNRTLLFEDEEGTWKCRGNTAIRIEESDFIDHMLGRFQVENFAEQVRSDIMTLSIDKNGRFKYE